MFIKLVVLILVCGSSGVGLLSVRQSRLQAAHEMAEARHRSQRLDERVGEIRTQIAQSCTPQRVIEMLALQHEQDQGYDPAVHHPVRFTKAQDMEAVVEADALDPNDPAWMDEAFRTEHSWILED